MLKAAIDIQLHDTYISFFIYGDGIYNAPLPPGSWKIIGLASELTEAQWHNIAEIDDIHPMTDMIDWRDYDGSNPVCAKQSGLSLLKSLNLIPQTTLILEKL
jgi:hypothetical protein